LYVIKIYIFYKIPPILNRILENTIKIIQSAFKIDLFRYGGCYSDIGHIIYKSFDDICEKSKLIIVKDLFNCGIHNGLMCSNKNLYIL
jgi:hypothetical protein